jgi:hypothetical protein
MPDPTISKDILRAALSGLQLDKQRIDRQIAEVQAMLEGGSRQTPSRETVPSVSDEAPQEGRRKRSPAVRRRMAEAQRARWAAIKGTSEPPSPITPEAAPGKRKKFSAATRRRMAEGQRLRYLKLKGQTESSAAPEPITPQLATPEAATPEAPKAKRRISAEGMKNIIAATKKRWRLQRAAAKAQSAPAKKATAKKAMKTAPAKATAKKAVKKAVKKAAPPAVMEAAM